MPPPVKIRRRPTVVDLFCGAGGLSEGFRQAGYSIVAGLDNDPDAMATYAANFPEAAAIVGDLRLPVIKEQVLSVARGVDVLVGGPPCQAFSQVRNHSRLIDDPRNSLYREFVDVLRDSRPSCFVMENVTGMDQMGVRDQIVSDLEMDGAYLVRPQVVDAADFGVPQTRKRLVFIGVRQDLGKQPPFLVGSAVTQFLSLARIQGTVEPAYQVISQEHIQSRQASLQLADPYDLSAVSAAEAIGDLVGLPTGNRDDLISYHDLPPPTGAYQNLMRQGARDLTNTQVPRINDDTRLRLLAVPPGGNYRDLNEDLLARYITGQRWGQSNGTGRLSRKHFYAYRRLHPDIWAWTLNTKADSVYHYAVPRALSVREFARLQSFPDRFVFVTHPKGGAMDGRHEGGASHSKYRQAGNAVPPLLARAIARRLAEVQVQGLPKRVQEAELV